MRVRISTQEMLVVCAAVLTVIAVGAGMQSMTHSNSPSIAAWTPGGDFAAFYMSGRILNEYGGERLYDLTLQEKLYREIRPDVEGLTLPYLYPPFIAALCRPLAYLPYRIALVVFLL